MNNAHPRPILQQPEDTSIRLIALTRGKVAVVDAADYDFLMQWNWCAQYNKKHDHWRAMRNEWNPAIKRSNAIYMHRLFMDAPISLQVDHRDGDGLNNRRSTNLRLATRVQNQSNRGPHKNNKSGGRKGVKWRPLSKKWWAYITVNRHQISLGYFSNPNDAAAAYAEAAKKYAGEFARTEPFHKQKEVA
jgi:hypothetical protein